MTTTNRAANFGSLARARRVSLGISADEMAARCGIRSMRLLRVEDGDVEPECGWRRISDELYIALGQWVDATRAAGEDPMAYRLAGWTAADIQRCL